MGSIGRKEVLWAHQGRLLNLGVSRQIEKDLQFLCRNLNSRFEAGGEEKEVAEGQIKERADWCVYPAQYFPPWRTLAKQNHPDAPDE